MEASSLFEAAFYGINRACRMSWYSPDAPIIVKMGDREWSVSTKRVLTWKETRPDISWQRMG